MKKITARKLTKFQEGFTLIELLVVIGILAILLAITLIAINPSRQFGQANNTKRRSAATQILNAIGAYIADNNGQLPAPITTTATEISSVGINLCSLLVPNYIPALPTNPTLNTTDVPSTCPAGYVTGYSVIKDANNRITVSALTTDNSVTITATR